MVAILSPIIDRGLPLRCRVGDRHAVFAALRWGLLCRLPRAHGQSWRAREFAPATRFQGLRAFVVSGLRMQSAKPDNIARLRKVSGFAARQVMQAFDLSAAGGWERSTLVVCSQRLASTEAFRQSMQRDNRPEHARGLMPHVAQA
jgi:hypothetical protein